MIASINSIVSKVVSTVSGPLHTWGSKPEAKVASKVKAVPAKAVSAKKAVKCKKSAKCKGKKCKCA